MYPVLFARLLESLAPASFREEVRFAAVLGVKIVAEGLASTLHQHLELTAVKKHDLKAGCSLEKTGFATQYSRVLNNLRELDKCGNHLIIGILVLPLKAVGVRYVSIIVIREGRDQHQLIVIPSDHFLIVKILILVYEHHVFIA